MEQQEDESRGIGEQQIKPSDEETIARTEEYKKSIDAKVALRQSNLKPERPDSNFLRTLDSSIKRNTAVIKKLKQINEEQREGIMEELKSVNLSKFVSEAVSAICDAKLRTSDMQTAVQICSLLHQRYKDFSPSLIQGLLKVFSAGKSGEDVEVDKNFESNKETQHSETSHGTLFSFKDLNITTDQKKLFRKAFYAYYDATAELLQSEHRSLRQMDLENSKILSAKGELSDENVNSYEKLRKSYDHLFRGVSLLAEALDMPPPMMPEDGHTTRVTTGDDASTSLSGKESSTLEPIWDDEDTRSFYECLPDLRAFVPAVLLGELEPKANENAVKTQETQSELTLEEQAMVQEAEVNLASESLREGKDDEKGKDKEDKDKEKARDGDKENDGDRKVENDKEKPKGAESTSFDALLQRLPGCVNRDLIDQLAVEFCYLNSKSNRKKLARALFNVPRTSLELLPYYSRMVATLSSCMKDVSSMLLQMLEEEFNFLINKKDQMNIETKIRNIRFIGELSKFRIASAGLVFSCLKACLDDFTHHNIDVACNLLETCGRFLYRSPETTVRMTNMLEILMRLKNVKNLDPRHSTLVENAYYLCKPPERSARVSKVRPPLHQYIRKLLFTNLDKSSFEHVLRQLRKLPWSECEPYILKCFMKVHKGKYSQVHLVAILTVGLSRYHDEFAVAVVDELLEEIRLGLEVNDYGMQQKRIAHMRFLGELYNYKHVESSIIFETLYLIMGFGHNTLEEDLLDPPEDCFRIRMIVTLLQTCGHYFDRGSSKRKLDRFLVYFQRYVLSKGSIPIDIEFDIQDLFAELRPNMTRYSTIEEVNVALLELEENDQSTNMDKATKKQITVRADGKGTEGNGQVQEEVDSDVNSESESIDQEGNEDEEELYEEKSENQDDGSDVDDDDNDDIADSDDDDDVQVRSKTFDRDLEEEADFDRELRALMQESIDSRKLELRTRPTLNMMIPMNIFDGSNKEQRRNLDGESGDDTVEEDVGGGNKVQVRVLVKKGNKQQTKQMYIPSDCSLVQSTKQKEAAELEEKQDIKRLVLEYNNREEEELNGNVTSQGTSWVQSGTRSAGRGTNLTTTTRSNPIRHRYHSSGGFYYGRRR